MPADAPSQNRLGGETSPYLLQHADNPVHWWAWGPEAMSAADAENKPILLSVGYAACHWCHVMAHESFENAAIAERMNALFINIKVDREERPDIDTIYQSALAMIGQQGGWPLTMFLTPEGNPFWGGTYFPPAPNYGRPGFPQILEAVARTYHDEKSQITNNVNALKEGLSALTTGAPGSDITEADLNRTSNRLMEAIDPIRGGMSGAPKFPQPPVFDFLLSEGARRADERFTARVTNTVWHMAQGGIYDHLGGGFARYSVDAEWLVPHFEKMAYDNAGLIRLMTRLYQKTKQPLLKRRIEETIGWVSAELRHDRGGFWSSYDADSEGVEGKYYVWTDEEIDAALGPNAARFKTAYDVSPSGNWEGRTILNRSHVAQDDEAEEEVLAPLRATLTSIRKGRVPPGLDDKILTDWNGLMIAAYAEAALVFDRPDWLAEAAETYRFVQQELTGDGGRLNHAWREGKARHAGILDDYANMADAALQLFEASGNRTYIADAEAFAEQVDTHFADGQEGGYFLTADDAEALIVRTKSALDSPTPSGNGTMVGVLARLAALTGKTIYRDRAQAIVTAFSGKMDQHFWGLSTLLANLGYLHRPDQVVIIGDREDPATHALSRTVVERYLPARILCLIEPDSALPEGHPAFGKNRVDDQPTAYYCPGQTCRAPVTDPADLAALLDGEGKP